MKIYDISLPIHEAVSYTHLDVYKRQGWMGEQELIGAPSVMVLFGGTGDLAKRKIYPALYHLNRKGLLPKSFSVIAIGRRPMNDGTYRKYLHSFMGEELGMTIRREVWETLSPRTVSYTHLRSWR